VVSGRWFVLLLLSGGLSHLVAADAPAQSYVVQTVAGSDFVGDGGPALAAVLSQAEGIAVDSVGAIYVADADDNRVRRIGLDGTIQTVAGTGVAGFAGDGGPANAALLSHPYGLAIDAIGNLYIADLGNARIRMVTIDGVIQTIAGGGTLPPRTDGYGGPAMNAQLLEPRNVALDSNGSLYISDFGVHRVYRVSGGTLITMAGSGDAGYSGDGSSALFAHLNAPAGLALDSTGALYIADSGNNCIRKVYRGIITTTYSVAAPTGLAIDGAGSLYIAAAGYFGTLSSANLSIASARDVAVDRASNVYVTTGSFVVQAIADGSATTIAGNGASRYFGGDNGPATIARLHSPSGVALDSSGNWYIADTANNRIRLVTPDGVISTLAGTGTAGLSGDNGPAALAQLTAPASVAVDALHNLYIADSGNNAVRKITPDGMIVTIAAALNNPQHLAVDAAGSVYIADTGNNRVVKVTQTGVTSIVTLLLQPEGVAADSDGSVLVSNATEVLRIGPSGASSKLVGGLNSPRGLALTADGDLLIADTGNNAIRRLTPSGSLTTIAFFGDGAAPGQLNAPADLAVDGNGVLWIADSGNHRVRTLTPSTLAADTAGITLVNAASSASGPIAPGEIITIFGSGFEPAQTQLLFDGQPATVFYTSAGQINALAPAGLAPDSSTELSVQVKGAPLASFPVPVTSAAPGIFTIANGKGPAAANNQDGSINSAANPAPRGSIVSLYATGQGSGPSAVTLKIAGYPAQVLFAGPAPGFPGLMQINTEVPAGFLPPGIQPVVLSIGNAQSQPGVTLAVR
jgi:trimeric autotransporter adhesin